jgi:hypothetical protein
MRALSIQTRSVRLAGREVLVTEVLTDAGAIGCGLSFRGDATESRHMAEQRAGLRGPDASLIASVFSPPPRPGSSGATR